MKIEALAHRGYPVKYPENTLLSYQAAYELGYTILELDVQLSKDGIPVIMHDITLDRTTDGHGLLKNFTLSELKKLNAGDTETIPTLQEALLYARGKMKVSVELKQKGNLYSGLEERVLEVIRETDMMEQVMVNSFDHYSIMRMRQLSDEIELGIIQSGASPAVIPFMKEINATYLSVPIHFITEEYARACREADKRIILWPVDDDEQFQKAMKYEGVLCTTNELQVFKSLYEKHRQKG